MGAVINGTRVGGGSDGTADTYSDAATFSNSITFSHATAPIVTAKLGPASGQQHALPAVASDTVALVGAAQTLTNKTLTAPTVNGAALSGTLSGTPTFSGAPTVAIDDATTNAVTNALTLSHTTSGTAAAGIGAGLLFRAEDAAGNAEDVAQLAATLSNVTNGAETGGLTVRTRTAGGALTDNYRFGGDGGLVIGSGFAGVTALGAAGVGLGNDLGIYGYYAAGGGFNLVMKVDTGGNVIWGNSTYHSRLFGATITFYPGGVAYGRWGADGGLVVGQTTALGGVGLGVSNACAIKERNAANSAWLNVATTNASDELVLGDASHRRIDAAVRFRLPRYTTTQRDALTNVLEGDVILNTTTHLINFYDGTTWRVVTST